jgi:hypothetical protein
MLPPTWLVDGLMECFLRWLVDGLIRCQRCTACFLRELSKNCYIGLPMFGCWQELPGTLVSPHIHPLDQHAGQGWTESQEVCHR